MKNVIFLISCACVFFSSVYGSSLLNSLRLCKKSALTQESIEECILKKLPDARDEFAEGDPEIGIPPMEPLQLADLNFTDISPNINLTCSFSKISIKGYTDYQFKKLRPDYDAKNLSIEIYYDSLLLNGRYSTVGRVSLLPINGQGTFWLKFDEFTLDVNLDLFIKDNHLQVDVTYTQFTTTKPIKMRFNNIFEGDPILAETVNVFLNGNSEDIIADIKPQLLKHLEKEFEDLSNNALKVISLDDIPGSQFLI